MKRLEQIITDFQKALVKLESAINEAENDLEIDGAIQRFEFCFELCWKTLKVYLEDEGIMSNSPKGCIKEAYKMDIINNEAVWLNMLTDRNSTSHIYDEKISREIFKKIKDTYLGELKGVMEKINNL